MAERSNWHEQNRVGAIVVEFACDLWTGVADERGGRDDRAHDAEVARGSFADQAGLRGFVEAIERENEVAVGFDAGVIEGVARLADFKRGDVGFVRDFAVRAVIVTNGMAEGLLTRHVEAGGGDEGDAGFVQRFEKTRARVPVDATERVGSDEGAVFELKVGELRHWLILAN